MHKSPIHEHASPNHAKKFIFNVYTKSIPCKFYNVLTYCSNYRLEHQPHSSPVSYVLGFCARNYAIVYGFNEKPYSGVVRIARGTAIARHCCNDLRIDYAMSSCNNFSG